MDRPTTVASAAVRPLTTGDLPRVVEIGDASLPSPWSATVFREELERADRCYLVALDVSAAAGLPAAAPASTMAEAVGAEIVGYAGLALQAGVAHVMTLAVHPSARGRGHGTRLVRALLAEAAARDADGVTLEVRAGNDVARRLYRRLGFRAAGMRPAYYPEGDDAVILWRRPGDGERR